MRIDASARAVVTPPHLSAKSSGFYARMRKALGADQRGLRGDRIRSGAGMSGSIWCEVAKGLPAGGVALVVGNVGGIIAYRQYRVAKAKLNLDLFENFEKCR